MGLLASSRPWSTNSCHATAWHLLAVNAVPVVLVDLLQPKTLQVKAALALVSDVLPLAGTNITVGQVEVNLLIVVGENY